MVINGAGAGGIGVAHLLLSVGFRHVLLCDRLGILHRFRLQNMNWIKLDIARRTNKENITGSLSDAVRDADVLIGLSTWSSITPEMIRSMAERPILFSLTVPDPGITLEAALDAGAAVVATALTDIPNSITNTLVLPGIFRGALDERATHINQEMLIAAAHAIADLVPSGQLSPKHIVPSVMDFAVAPCVARAVAEAAMKSGVARVTRDLDEVESQGYCFQIDLAIRAIRAGLRVIEVPITFVERVHGSSKMSRAVVAEALWRVTVWGLTGRGRPRRRGRG